MDGLNLHAGGDLVTYDQLRDVPLPEPTPTHIPLAHHRLVDLVMHSLAFYGHEVVEQHHALDHDGMRYFGLLTLRSAYDGNLYTDTLGLRNSNDRKFPIGLAFGSRVFVCSNLAFIADHVIKRKHTANSRRDLPGLIAELVEPLAIQREAQARTFITYRATPVTVMTADHAIMDMFRGGILNVQRIPEVLEAFEKPPHEEWGDHTAWTLFNATTAALNGRVSENPGVTAGLHKIIDGVCREVA